jgi:acetoin utilization deacetylase AcuC-like enzyme
MHLAPGGRAVRFECEERLDDHPWRGGPLQVSADGYRRTGELIGGLGPVVAVQEGGYDLAALGPLAVAALGGLVAAA